MASSQAGRPPPPSSSGPASTAAGQQPQRDPLIPLDYCDAPNQRFYAISLLALQQSYKLFQFIEAYASQPIPPSSFLPLASSSGSRSALLWKWALYDFVTLGVILPTLRIPRLSWTRRASALLISALLIANWILAGEWKIANLLAVASLLLPTSLRDIFSFDLAISEHRIRWNRLVDPASHILGSHTIHILPHSTAKFLTFDSSTSSGTGSAAQCFCVSTSDSIAQQLGLPGQSRAATLPLLLNNTQPKYLQYSVQAFGGDYADRRLYNLTSKDLRRLATHGSQRRRRNDYDYDDEAEEQEEYDFEGSSGTIGQRVIGYDMGSDASGSSAMVAANGVSAASSHAQARENAIVRNVDLQKTQSIYSFSVTTPGIVRIERIIDKSDNDVRIPHEASESAKMLVVPCPSASFSAIGGGTDVKAYCSGDDATAAAGREGQDVEVFGYPPLRLSYHKLIGNTDRRESYSIDSIAPDGAIVASRSSTSGRSGKRDPKNGRQQQIVLGSQETLSGSPAVPQIVRVPLNISLIEPGAHLYRLDKVTDACGNSLDFSALRERYASSVSDGTAAAKAGEHKASGGLGSKLAHKGKQSVAATLEQISSRKMLVYPRSQVSFVGCGTGSVAGSGVPGAGQPVKVLKGKRANLQLSVNTEGSAQKQGLEDGPWDVKVRFEPEEAEDRSDKVVVKTIQGWEKTIKLGKKSDLLEIDQPGRYSIVSFSGSHCSGEILEPSECRVYTPALPTADLSVVPITDSCAGEVGLKATVSLSGEPPYKLHYTVQHGSSRPLKKTKVIRLSRDEIELRPEQTGDFTYRFKSIDDKNYEGIKIDREVKQTVHPLAGVKFSQAGKEQKVWSCQGDNIQVPLELKGIAPWKVDYRIVGEKQVYTISDISQTKHSLDVQIPPKIAREGGTFTLSIVQVVDGRGCSQPITVDDLVINVHRSKPTATFAQSKKVTVKQGEAVHIPLRLTGEGPWTIGYLQPGSSTPKSTVVRTNNGVLTVSDQGHYELLSVSDAHCPGTINAGSKTYDIDWLPRPSVRLAETAGSLVKNGSLIRPPVCEGVDDTAGVTFEGKAPFLVSYELIEEGSDGVKRRQVQELQSVQKHAQFELSTGSAGHRVYDFKSMSDATYSTLSKDSLQSPVGSAKQHVVRLEQDVLARPTAAFADAEQRPVFCVRDSLQTSRAQSPTLRLTGQAPFRVELEISPDGSHMSQRYSDILVKSNTWKLDLPHTFSEPGPYTIHLRKVVDSTGCERLIPRGAKGSFARLEVAEIASITAVQPQVNHCVGDSIDFVLQGAAPWNIQYDFEGKKQKVTNRDSRFSRVAEQAGVFKILSVAHHQDSCKSAVTDISKIIHPLPRARVHAGSTFIENIREGDQAEIVFELEGTPPFSFTYTKSAPIAPNARGKKATPQVLETHTITGVEANRYSVFTQSEGTWNVVSVQDRFCAYPPLARSDRKAIKN